LHTTLKTQLGVKTANCTNCKSCVIEDEYKECLLIPSKANLVSFPFTKEQECWAPTFWKTSLILSLGKVKWINNMIYFHYEQITGECIGGKCTELTRFELFVYNIYYKQKLLRRSTSGN